CWLTHTVNGLEGWTVKHHVWDNFCVRPAVAGNFTMRCWFPDKDKIEQVEVLLRKFVRLPYGVDQKDGLANRLRELASLQDSEPRIVMKCAFTIDNHYVARPDGFDEGSFVEVLLDALVANGN